MDAYDVMEKIGDGSFGQVYLCRRKKRTINRGQLKKEAKDLKYYGSRKDDNDEHETVAIKKMNKKYLSWDECIKSREIIALKKLNHSNIIRLKEVIRENDKLYLVFEHMKENLYELIRSRIIPFSEDTIKQISSQILSGLSYMHRHGFFHRDIKPENLLCNGPQLVKIADFGLTREIKSTPPYTDYVSTRWYRAPELLLHSKTYTFSVDIWAIGCIIGELYTLQPLFPGRSEIDQLFKICLALGSPDIENWPEGLQLSSIIQFNFPQTLPTNLKSLLTNCSTLGLDLIQSMLAWIPCGRPKAETILRHQYFTSKSH